MFERRRAFGAYYPKAMTDEEIESVLSRDNLHDNEDLRESDKAGRIKHISYDIFNLTFAQIKDLIEKSEGDISVHIHIRAVDGD